MMITTMGLILLTVLSHLCLLSQGMVFTNSEWSAFLLVADEFRKGQFSAFAFQQQYGGLTLTAFRALFSAGWDSVRQTPFAHAQGHMVFSYLICPIIMTLASYALARAYVSKTAALVVGTISAIGLPYWIYHYGNDFYPFYFVLTCILLATRAKTDNPIKEFSSKKLFFVAALCGHLYYQTGAMKIVIMAYFLPWQWALDQWNALRKSRFLPTRILLNLGLVLIVSGIYLEIFGRDVGTVAGRVLKLDGDPNLTIGGFCLAFAWLASCRKKFDTINLSKASALVAGFIIGNTPEIIHNLLNHRLFSPTNWATQDFTDSMKLLGILPSALSTFFVGETEFRLFRMTELGALKNAAIILGVISLFMVFQQVRKRKDLQPAALIILATLYGYVRVFTRVPEVGPPRYLFPMYASLILGLALTAQYMLESRKRHIRLLLCFLFILTAAHGVTYKSQLVHFAEATGLKFKFEAIALATQSMAVDTVISDDFWYSNNLTVLTQSKPGFWMTWRDWGPFDIKTSAQTDHRVGILLSQDKTKLYPRAKEYVFERWWTLKPVAQIDGKELYLGTSN